MSPRIELARLSRSGVRGSLHHAEHAVVHSIGALPRSLLHRVAQRSVLEQWWLAGIIVAAGFALAAGWLVWRHYRKRAGVVAHHRFLVNFGVGVVSFLTVLLGAAVGVNAYAGYAPSISALWGSVPAVMTKTVVPVRAGTAHRRAGLEGIANSGSDVIRLGVGDPRLLISTRATFVYLPPGYFDPHNATLRYPVLYLMHGNPGRSSDWLLAGRLRQTMDSLIAARLVHPMIIVMPQVSNSFIDDSECLNLPGRELDESYLTGTVVHVVDSILRTEPMREGRAVGGMSAGAFCALNLGLRHTSEFSTILASEPYSDPGRHLIAAVGGPRAWRANSPRFYLPAMKFHHRMSVFLDAGSRDHETLTTARWLAAQFARKGQYVALRVAPDEGHTWTTARMELPYALVFASQHLSPPTSHTTPA